MTMETIAILGITLIITLMLGVVTFAYKASCTTSEKMINLGHLQSGVRALWRDMVSFRYGCVGAGSVR
jgi:hypothetical protein